MQSTFKSFNHLKRHYIKGIWTIIRNFNFKFVLFACGYPSTYRVWVWIWIVVIYLHIIQFMKIYMEKMHIIIINAILILDPHLFVESILWIWIKVSTLFGRILVQRFFLLLSAAIILIVLHCVHHWNFMATHFRKSTTKNHNFA